MMIDERLKRELKKNFKARNIEVVFFDSLSSAQDAMMEMIPADVSVGMGDSRTLMDMNLSQLLRNRGNVVYDKTLAKDRNESRQIKKLALLADWFVTGSNAVSKKGQIVNIDHSGNRVAAMSYGPDHVIVVVGKNKICDTLEEAIHRARSISAPMNARRAGYHPPCLEAMQCVDCHSAQRVCFYLMVVEGQCEKDRMTLCIIEEEAGF